MEVKSLALEFSGLKEFNPMQKLAFQKDWQSKSMVVSAPTASGKTLLAEIVSLNSVINKRRKVAYTCPLRALASEHYGEFRRKYSKLGIRVALSTGDLDSSSSYLQNYDIIFTTYEKLDSMQRHNADWLSSIGLLVIDEVHFLGSDRGPTIEVATTKLKQLNPELQVLALSATIPNARDIAEWLNAEFVESDFRPIPLKEGVFFDGCIEYKGSGGNCKDKELLELKEPLKAVLKDTIVSKKKQALVFANTRKRAEGIAKTLAPLIEKNLSEQEKKFLQKESGKVLNALEQPTEQCRSLAQLFSQGVAFHHAGLLQKQRAVIEDAFRENRLKLIVATPTLAAGINTPSHTVIIPSLYRYTAAGMQRIPVSEYKQMVGRCVGGETTVFTKEGPIKISEIVDNFFKEGETGCKPVGGNLFVLSVDLDSGEPVFSKIEKVWRRKTSSLFEVETRSGKVISITAEHPLLSFSKIDCGKARIACHTGHLELYERAKSMKKEFGFGPAKIAKEIGVPKKIRMVQHWFYDNSKPFPNPFEWRAAKDLKKTKGFEGTDYLASLLDFSLDSTCLLGPQEFLPLNKLVRKGANAFMVKQGHHTCSFPIKWSSDLVRFIAKIMSDGSIYYDINDNSYQIRYYNKNKGVQKEYAKIILRLFGKKVSLKWRRGSYGASFKSFLVGAFLKNIGVPAGKKSFVLRVPKPIFLMPKELVKAFVREYSQCDGWETPLTYCLITSSKLLARDFAILLSKIGFVARVHRKKPNTFRKNEIWEISVTKSQFDKNKKLGCVAHIHPDLIKKISSKADEQLVYDLTLEKSHNFIANGLVVHNSGRPKYDTEGRGVIVARSEIEKEELFEEYVNGTIEPVESRLGMEPVLRTHLLALIATGFISDLESMEDFFKKTFFARQYGSMQSLFGNLQRILGQLQEMGFILADEKKIHATPLGSRVSELYLDPLSAFGMISGLKSSTKFSPLSYLSLLCNCSEMMPWLSVPKSNEAGLWEQLQLRKTEMPIDLEKEMFFDLNLLGKLNTALMFEQWIEEAREQAIMDDFRTQPGILHSKLSIADWLCYSALELSKLLLLERHFSPISKLRKRLLHGIKEELIALTEVRYIGRVRARRLWRSNVRAVADLKKIDIKDLARILGFGIAEKVKQAIGQGK